jgi:hypothetical protein
VVTVSMTKDKKGTILSGCIRKERYLVVAMSMTKDKKGTILNDYNISD